jgi:hypothetical protein
MDPTKYEYQDPADRDFIVFQKGEYAWKILEINEMTTGRNSGNSMLPIKFEFSDGTGRTTTVEENLVFCEAAKWKIDQFMKACSGQMAPGRKINFTDADTLKWIKARTGTAKLKIEKFVSKAGKDCEKNAIEAFLYGKTTVDGATLSTPPAKQQPPSAPVEEADDDHIPF